jgi:two-component system chemotaxis response regulator CheB
VQAVGGEPIRPGTVYVAPPDNHLLANADRTLALTQTELVHFVRPSADLLFESVAAAYRERSIAVVLTGSGSDGAMGVEAIKKMGGTVIAQDEATSEFFAMPSAAIETGKVDFVLPIEEMAPALLSLVVGR